MDDEVKTGESTSESTTTTPNPVEEQFKQLKGEFNRKFSDTNKLIEQMSQTNAELTQQIAALVKPKQKPAPQDSLEKLMYTDPAKYTQIIEERATQRAVETVRQETSSSGAVQQRIAALAAEYPELADNDSELTKASVEILKAANAMQKNDPNTYEYAVLKAAQQLDVKAKSKRPKVEEDFMAPSYSSPQSRSRKQSDEKIIYDNKAFGEAVGINLEDPKTKKRYLDLLKKKGLV